MANCTFLEPGTDATQDLTLFQASSLSSGTSASASDQAHTGTRSLKSVVTSGAGSAYTYTPDGVISDAGACVSCWVRFLALPAGPNPFLVLARAANGATVFNVMLNTNGTLRVCGRGTTQVSGSTVLSIGTWYRISVAYVFTSTTVWSAKVYINGVLEKTTGNADGNLALTPTASAVQFGINPTFDNGFTSSTGTIWFDDIYIDDRTDQSDCGAVQVTAKRPNANGTTNGFSTQIGAGGSGYGSGHSPQVNEQPLSITNGWSMVGAGSAITEEYNIENKSTGDVDVSSATFVAIRGWVYAKAALSETGKIVVDGTQTNIALTSTTTLFTQNSATPTVFPAGSGTDIGIVTATTVTTVSLYECGVLVAYIPSVPAPWDGWSTISQPTRHYRNEIVSL